MTRGYKVTAYEGSPWLWVPAQPQGAPQEDLRVALEECVGIADSPVGEVITITVCELSDKELAEMPEFEGF